MVNLYKLSLPEGLGHRAWGMGHGAWGNGCKMETGKIIINAQCPMPHAPSPRNIIPAFLVGF
jgi:hypothetical protein